MNIYEFMEQNNIAIVAKADLPNNIFNIFKRDMDLESYDLFNQLILFNTIDNLIASLDGQIIPQMWGQGNTQCVLCRPNNDCIVALFYDCCLGAKESYFYAEKLDILLKDVFI